MKYATLSSKLTLEEKTSLLSGKGNFTTKEIERLGIPSAFLSDGPHGLRKQAGAADHLGLNMKRSPLCGRAFEYFSEDPYLAGKLTAAYICGIQSKGVSACPKHFAVNSQQPLLERSGSTAPSLATQGEGRKSISAAFGCCRKGG